MKRKIAVATSSRADYGHLYWPLRELKSNLDVELCLIAFGPHLSPRFGQTIREIENDGFPVDERIETLLSSDTDLGMAKTIGITAMGFADTLSRMRPDILLLIADRYEMLAPACVALGLRIPIAHIEGGEVSEGAIDDAVRNALTKLSHIHLTTTELARRRVIAMGEEPWRVHCVGSPTLDHLRRSVLIERTALAAELGLDPEKPLIVVTYHPVTIEKDTVGDANALFSALENVTAQIAFCYPNADAGSYALIAMVEEFCRSHSNAHVFVNLPPVKYWSLLRCASAFVGNSSSGIMETPSLELPAVNIGARQRGRERAPNIVDADADMDSIWSAIQIALDPAFRKALQGMTNPYGDGRSAERIAEILAGAPIGQELLVKKAMPVIESTEKSSAGLT